MVCVSAFLPSCFCTGDAGRDTTLPVEFFHLEPIKSGSLGQKGSTVSGLSGSQPTVFVPALFCSCSRQITSEMLCVWKLFQPTHGPHPLLQPLENIRCYNHHFIILLGFMGRWAGRGRFRWSLGPLVL